MLHNPQWMPVRSPCDSRELKIIRPSLRTTGCRAMPMFKWPMHSTLLPSSSITNRCRQGDGGILTALDKPLLLAVGMQQHQVGAGIHQGRMRNLRPGGAALVSIARGADVDDVVVNLDALVGREVWRGHVDGAEEQFLLRL